MSTIYDWSLTASENAGADSVINWSEGQAPHTVNNSARGMMQRYREYLSESGGAVESVVVHLEHEQTTIRLTSKTEFREYKNDRVVRFRSNGWNIGATTVSVNLLEGKPVYKATQTGLVPLTGSEIQPNCIYTLVYDEAVSGWQLLNPTIKTVPFRRLPTGFIGSFAMEILPDGWLLCDGRAYSRDSYRDLFATIGTLWGEGDGATTFQVPDLRGMFLRGYDYLGSVDRERSFASTQQCSLRDHEHSLWITASYENSSRRGRDLSSVESSHRQRRSADPMSECLRKYSKWDDVEECILSLESEEEKQARKAENLRRRNSMKGCFSSNLWDGDNPDCFGVFPSVDHENVGEEECVGLTGDALERCNRGFDEATQTPPSTPTRRKTPHTSHPFFIAHDQRFSPYLIPKRFGEDLGEHDHILMPDSYGGTETRPRNVSVVFGIKT
ncbi:hypothetical protein MEI_00502 [Bartonella vinsonii subsp. arupensis Pm136co]|uniref:Phage tail collar domain-containing protein n=1 Tax=Bartonella vinsonii subsp. arupensis Pm136co TaxID=1094561 RepID=A0ABP2QY20_BARVI|nr:phage tail protein [Bartonella vinsonii]EJF98494.1 hypothetical protein MEI_00502 [Bartonella vinsonii subsp. arupensis Pm136co]